MKKNIVVVLIVLCVLCGIFVAISNANKQSATEVLLDTVESAYEDAVSGKMISYELTCDIGKKYRKVDFSELTEEEWDELDRKINVIAEASFRTNPDLYKDTGYTPFKPVTKQLRTDEPAGPWAGPTD